MLGGGGQRGKNWDNYDSTINFYLGSVVDSCEFVVLLFIFFIFSFSQISPFNISYNKGLVMNTFNLTFYGKHFIFPSIQNESFAGQSNLGCRSLLFMT